MLFLISSADLNKFYKMSFTRLQNTFLGNAVLGNFAPLTLRTDVGALWENWLVSERIKRLSYAQLSARSYFWRTTTQSEIDYIEESDGQITAFEFKWNPRDKAKLPQSFASAYPNAAYSVISRENYDGFLR